jgi:hypothetical protein
MTGWNKLGGRDPLTLEDSRLQIHWTAQAIASVGMAFGEPADDDSHTNTEWLDRGRMLAGQVTSRMPPFRVALDPASLTLLLLDLEGDEIGRLGMDGLTLDQGYDWLSAMIGTLIEEDDVQLDRPTYDLPHHPVADGKQFAIDDPDSFAEVGHWFGNADLVLREIQKDNADASPVRCWPHHFDIATLIQIDADAKTSIGVGMTPGDGNYPEPYWYISPWPYPEKPQLPDLPFGKWHTEGWIGAVLTGSAVVAAGDADAQRERSADFVKAAIESSKALLNA